MKKTQRSRSRFILLVACFLVTYLVSTLFMVDTHVRVLLTVLSFSLPYRGLRRLSDARQLSYIRQQYARFIQDLSVSMSEGHSLEQGLLQTGLTFTAFYGRHNRSSNKVAEANRLLQAQVPVQEILDCYQEAFPCPEAQALFVSLDHSLYLGEQTQKLLRASSRMTAELSIVLREAQQVNQRQNTEALFLAMMPPIMLLLISRASPDYFTPAYESPLSQTLLIVAFILSIISCSLAFSFAVLAQPDKAPKTKSTRPNRWAHRVSESKACHAFGRLYQRLLPRSYRSKLSQSLLSLRSALPLPVYQTLSRKQLTLDEMHFLWKLPLFLLGLLWSLVLSTVEAVGFKAWLLPLFIFILHDLYQIEASKTREDQLQREFPLFLNQIIVLLEAGLMPIRALELAVPASHKHSVLQDELQILFRDLQAGISLADALTGMATRITVPDIQQALNALASHAVGGSDESLAVLRIQGQQCWQLARQSAQQDSERVAARMFIPMILDLLAIILISLAPVVTNFVLF